MRLSGPRALEVARKIFRLRGKTWPEVEPLTLILGDILDGTKNGIVDEGYLAYFPGPRSYTREDIVEISCHGSPVVLEEVVRLGTKAGARLAPPGEFTLRAFLNGRLDLIQAQAVNDLIAATSLAQARISVRQLRGGLSRHIGLLRGQLVDLLSKVESGIEFPDEGVGASSEEIAAGLERLVETAKNLIASYQAGRAMTQGLDLAIVGRANVGKSTLFNALLNEDRAIVSPYPGTTRDYLRERIKLGDSLFRLIDLAGLEETTHPIEMEGVKKSEEIASQAHGILLVLDASRRESEADLTLIKRFVHKKTVLVFNKADLPRRINRPKCLNLNKKSRWVEVSALTGENLGALRIAISVLFEGIADCLEKALGLLRKGHSDEVWVEEIRSALPLLAQLTGEIRADEVIDHIFSQFCVGK